MVGRRVSIFLGSVAVVSLGLVWVQSRTVVWAQAGQQAQTPTAGTNVPLFRTHSNLVLVDVVVQSGKKPVEGLTRGDFHVFEDGRPQTVSFFQEHRATDAVKVAKAPVNLPPHTFSNAPRYAVTSAANVLLLDGLNTPVSDQVYVRRRMLQYLKTIPVGTRVAVFTMGTHLRMVQGFTTDSETIHKALTEKRGSAQLSPLLDPMLNQTLTDMIDEAGGQGATYMAQVNMAQFEEQTENFTRNLRAEMTMDAFSQLGRYLSTIPGRKNVIWFAGSMPFSMQNGATRSFPAAATESFMAGSDATADEMADFGGQLKRLLELLTVARVALYPVDARGLEPNRSDMAENHVLNPQLLNVNKSNSQNSLASNNQANGTVNQGGAQTGLLDSSTVGDKLAKSDDLQVESQQWRHLHMEEIARETGGEAFYDQNGLGRVLGEAIANGSNYYTLGYVPTDPNYDGAYRRIRVAVNGEDYKLEYRRGYYAANPAKVSTWVPGRMNPLIAAMQHGSIPLSQVRFDVRILPAGAPALRTEPVTPGPAGALATMLKPPVTRYIADYWIKPSQLSHTVLPNGIWHSELELTQVAYTPGGIRKNYTDVGLAVNVPPSRQNDPIRLEQQIDLPPGLVYLRVGVRDLKSGQIGTLEVPLKVSGGPGN